MYTIEVEVSTEETQLILEVEVQRIRKCGSKSSHVSHSSFRNAIQNEPEALGLAVFEGEL
jgi:hypothetical protein